MTTKFMLDCKNCLFVTYIEKQRVDEVKRFIRHWDFGDCPNAWYSGENLGHEIRILDKLH